MWTQESGTSGAGGQAFWTTASRTKPWEPAAPGECRAAARRALALNGHSSLDSEACLSEISVMTETTDHIDVLPEAIRQFVLRWGDMGGQWGVNRSVAQIHALLYLAEKPMTADDIVEVLGIARSNVSTSLRELMGWKLVRRVPVFGDRRDHYEAEADLWQMLVRIAAGRKEREIDPMVEALREVMAAAEGDPALSRVAKSRLKAMHEFVTTMDGWYGQMLTVPPSTLMALINMGAKVVGLLGLGRAKAG
jgi:DNA-binding transcriptional regulator GbsR (MarR family)